MLANIQLSATSHQLSPACSTAIFAENLQHASDLSVGLAADAVLPCGDPAKVTETSPMVLT